MRQIELAWAAGFFDGEGCLTVAKRKTQKPALSLVVSQSDIRPLERFAKLFDVNISGPIVRKDSGFNQRPSFRITVRGKKAWEIYRELEPYLSEPKKEQLISCLDRGAIVW